MKRLLYILACILFIHTLVSCKSQYNKGITNKKDFRPRKPPSVRLKQEYDDIAKKASKGERKLKGKSGKSLDKALEKQKARKRKKDKRYIKKIQKRAKKN